MSSVQSDIRPVARGNRVHLAAWIQLAGLALFVGLAMPFFLGRVYVADDLGQFHLPLRDFYAQQLALGEPFDWMSSLYGGFYVSAEGQLGGYHPWHWLLYRWLPLGAAFDLELLASYPLLFAGTYFFLRRFVTRIDAALYGALVFTFGGFNLLHFVHPNAVAVVAHLPWLLLALDVALTTNRARRRALAELAIGLLTASQLLLGYPQFVWFSLLMETAYFVWRAASLGVPWRRMGWIVVAKVLGLAGGALQWIPTLDLLGDSLRKLPNAAFADTGSLHPLNLVQFLAPYLFSTRVVGQNTHELGLYVGAVPCLLCLWLATHRGDWGKLAPAIKSLAVFGAVALVLAAGEHGVLYRVQAWLPLANRFRFPCRAIVLVQFCIAAGAAIALGLLLDRNVTPKMPRSRGSRWPLAGAFALSVALAVAGPIFWPPHVAGLALVWSGPILIGTAASLIALVERGARGSAVALVLFTALDLGCYGFSYTVYPHTADLQRFVASALVPPQGPNRRVAVAEGPGGLRTGNQMLLAGAARVDGYAGLEPRKRLDYRTLPALRLAGAGWIYQPNFSDPRARATWQAVAGAAPRARLVDPIAAAGRIGETKVPEVRTAASDDAGSLVGSAAGVQVVGDTPGRITVRTHSPRQELLVTTESFHHGWRAVVDGHERPVVRVDGDFLATAIDAGDHRVDFEFRPRSLWVGALISAGGLGLLLCRLACGLMFRSPARPQAGTLKCHDLPCLKS